MGAFSKSLLVFNTALATCFAAGIGAGLASDGCDKFKGLHVICKDSNCPPVTVTGSFKLGETITGRIDKRPSIGGYVKEWELDGPTISEQTKSSGSITKKITKDVQVGTFRTWLTVANGPNDAKGDTVGTFSCN
jgi:hypothetical protein